MEHTITYISLDHLIDMQRYAKMCGIDSRAVQRRIREKQVACVKVDGIKLIDIETTPPLRKLPRGYKNDARVDTKGLILSDLVRISKLAADNRITTTRFFKAILAGRLRAVLIAQQFYVYKSDPAFAEVMKEE